MSYQAITFFIVVSILIIFSMWCAIRGQSTIYKFRLEVQRLRELERISAMSDEDRLCELELSGGYIYCRSPQAAALADKINIRKQNAIDAARWREAKNWMFIHYDTAIPPRNLIYSCTLKPSSMPSVSSPQTDIAEVFQAAFERDIDIEISKQKKLNINSLSATIKFQDGSTIKTDGYVEDETASNDDISVR